VGGEADDGDNRDKEQRSHGLGVGAENDCGMVLAWDRLAHDFLLCGD
jgi:hypothetical protein